MADVPEATCMDRKGGIFAPPVIFVACQQTPHGLAATIARQAQQFHRRPTCSARRGPLQTQFVFWKLASSHPHCCKWYLWVRLIVRGCRNGCVATIEHTTQHQNTPNVEHRKVGGWYHHQITKSPLVSNVSQWHAWMC